MKKVILSLLLGSICSSALMAAENVNINICDGDTTIVYNNLFSKEISTHNGVSKHKWNLNFLSIETKSHSLHRRSWHHSSNLGADDIYIGFAGMADTKGFEIKSGNSWEWGFSLMNYQVWSPNNHFGIETALYLSRSSYRIKGDNAFDIDENGLTVCNGEPYKNHEFSKPRLIHWSWRVPVMLNFQTNSSLRFKAGAEAEFRHHIRSRAKDGKKKYYINRNSLDVETFGWNALVGIGTDEFTVFGRYNLTDFFGDKSLVDAQPFTIGVNFRL